MEMTRKRASNSFRRKLRPALAFHKIPPRANDVKHQWVSWTAEKREPRAPIYPIDGTERRTYGSGYFA